MFRLSRMSMVAVMAIAALFSFMSCESEQNSIIFSNSTGSMYKQQPSFGGTIIINLRFINFPSYDPCDPPPVGYIGIGTELPNFSTPTCSFDVNYTAITEDNEECQISFIDSLDQFIAVIPETSESFVHHSFSIEPLNPNVTVKWYILPSSIILSDTSVFNFDTNESYKTLNVRCYYQVSDPSQ